MVWVPARSWQAFGMGSVAINRPFPPPSMWNRLGLRPESEVYAGHQSRVFVARDPGATRRVVKLVESGEHDVVFRYRIELLARLAARDPAVVGPLDVGSDLVLDIEGWQVVCYPHIDGVPPDVDDRATVLAMATTMARLHESMAALAPVELPPVAALATAEAGPGPGRGRLVHGDYGAPNLIATPVGLRVIDFDDCGLGTVEFDIGNSLYLVCFDAWRSGELDRYLRFRSRFVGDYLRAAPVPSDISRPAIDEAIGTRLRALDRWLRSPGDAPAGIRTASPEWHDRLRRFVDWATEDGPPG